MKFPFRNRPAQRGVVLVIVLSFVVILTVLVLAFFSRALLDQQISTSSSSVARTDLFAQGALSTILGDLQDEIVSGSNTTKAPSNYTALPLPGNTVNGKPAVYVPNTPGTVMPGLALPGSLISGNAPAAANLVKISQTGIPFYPANGQYASAAQIRASSIGTATASLNGRTISLARWNKALLLPKKNTSTTDFTPATGAFVDPDWVLVTRSGAPYPTPTFGAGNTANNPAQSNSNYVVGRYAYAIYDEGGLLDANAAGAPAPVSAAPATPADASLRLASQAFNHKGSEAFADLAQLSPATVSGDSTTQLLSNTAINNLVGWRNYVTAGTTGNFPSLTPGWASYYANILFNTSGFATGNPLGFATGFLRLAQPVSGSATNNNQTDRLFTSRQQLISFLSASDPGNLANTQTALQYLTHFNRDLDQPLIIPNPSRPKIIDNGTTSGTAGNSEFGNDTDNPADSTLSHYVNPDFLNIPTNITAGKMTPAVIKRFPLSRLALFTPYPNAPTADQNSLIYKYFGLTRSRNSDPWVYDHGGNAVNAVILTLREVGQQNRAPDFFEMLKASIVAGSLAKGSGTVPIQSGAPMVENNEMKYDTNLDNQILQIGVNLIDQYKSDNYPTRIKSLYNSVIVSGDEDLPNFYRIRHRPLPTGTGIYSDGSGTSAPSNVTTVNGVLLFVPEVWNAHMRNPNDTSIQGPTDFRIYAELINTYILDYSTFLYYGVNPPQGNFEILSQYGYIGLCPTAGSTAPDSSNCAILFSSSATPNAVGTSAYYRQPTTLGEMGNPSSINLKFDSSNGPFVVYIPGTTPPPSSTDPFIDTNGKSQVGFLIGSIVYQVDPNMNIATAYPKPYVVSPQYFNQANGYLQVNLEYKDPNGNWIQYDTSQVDPTQILSENVGPADDTWAAHQYGFFTRFDPRTSRWVMPGGAQALPEIGPGTQIFPSQTPTGATADNPGTNLSNPAGTGFISSPSGNGDGGRSQKNVGPGNTALYSDADGVIRPASASYSTQDSSLPLATNNYNANSREFVSTPNNRPILLHRPFRSVAEMAYAFTGTPWKNIDFTNPQSGFSALLEAFCLNENDRDDGMVAGRVNLNTRQIPVLKALLTGAYVDEFGTQSPINESTAYQLAKILVNRTESTAYSSGQGPLESRGDLVGRFVSGTTYSGFSGDMGSALPTSSSPPQQEIPRWREAALRGLADVGTARTWNLMIDIIAQTGRYPVGLSDPAKFMVEGEKRYWLHVAIDRFTGKIIDQQLEPVSE